MLTRVNTCDFKDAFKVPEKEKEQWIREMVNNLRVEYADVLPVGPAREDFRTDFAEVMSGDTLIKVRLVAYRGDVLHARVEEYKTVAWYDVNLLEVPAGE